MGKFPISNTIGIGGCIMAWCGVFPYVIEKLGFSLNLGILISALSIGIFLPFFIYKSLNETSGDSE